MLIDGHSLAFRVYYGLEKTGMSTSDNTPVWAVYGFFNALFRLLQKIQPDAMAISFDVGRETFRTEMYDLYKANRDAMPEPMRQQMDLIREGVEKLGIPIYELKGYEADDVIGTLSRQAVDEGYHVQILTGDQDAFQLVQDGKIEVLVPPRTPKDAMKTYTREEVLKKMGVYPEQVPDFKGLKGDPSDNIPGVPGVGDKTASKLLGEFGSLEQVYNNIDSQKGKLKERLETNRDQAFLSKKLAIIQQNSPINADFSHCSLHIPDHNAFFEYLDRMEFRNFKKQAPELLKPFLNGHAAALPAEESNANSAQTITTPSEHAEEASGSGLPSPYLRVPHRVITDKQQLIDLVTTLTDETVFSLDIETTGLDVFNDTLVGISISYYWGKPWQRSKRKAVNILKLADYPDSFQELTFKNSIEECRDDAIQTVYIPVGHVDSDKQQHPEQLPEATVLEALTPLLVDEKVVKIAHNAKFELNFFRKLGIEWRGLVFDTMIASYIHRPDRRHGLKSLSYELFKLEMQEITDLIGTGKKQIPFSQVPLADATEYAACDAYVTLKLAAHFIAEMDTDRQTLFYEIEMPTTCVLARMEWEGIRINVPYLETLSKDLEKRLTAIEADIYTLAGTTFNINSPKQVGEVLFDKLGIQPLRKTKSKSGYSTDAKVLEQLSKEHDVVQRILDYRQLFKLKSTYVDSLPTMVNTTTQRIHTSFNQTVAATGRLSSSEPNLQNIPIRSEEGRLIRGAFVPRNDGEVLLSADYSQIELRMLAHVSQDPSLIQAFNAGEGHSHRHRRSCVWHG